MSIVQGKLTRVWSPPEDLEVGQSGLGCLRAVLWLFYRSCDKRMAQRKGLVSLYTSEVSISARARACGRN